MTATKTKVMGFFMVLVLAFSAPLVYADNGNGGNFGAGGSAVSETHHRKGMFFHKLNLTDDQKKQLKGIWQKQREDQKAVFEQIKTSKEALTNELLQTTPDLNKVNDLKSKLEALGAQMLDNRINSDLEVKKILNAEQFAKYLELQKKMFARHFHKGRGHCGIKGHCRDHQKF